MRYGVNSLLYLCFMLYVSWPVCLFARLFVSFVCFVLVGYSLLCFAAGIFRVYNG